MKSETYNAWDHALNSKPKSEWMTIEQIDALPPQEPKSGTSETWKRYCEKAA